MFTGKTIRDIDVKGMTVLVRTDYNVPLISESTPSEPSAITSSESSANPSSKTSATPTAKTPAEIANDLRLRASLPTLRYLLEHGAEKIILISHLGRPAGRRDPDFTLRPVALRLAELLPGVSVNFVDETTGPEVEMAVESLPEGGILLLENLRFSPEEEANSADFAREIVASTGAELFVQDGFAVTHRAHASTVALAELLPSVAGLLVEREVSTLSSLLESPAHPFVVIIGGSKVEDKQHLIEKFTTPNKPPATPDKPPATDPSDPSANYKIPKTPQSLADKILVGGKIAADGYASTDPEIYVAEDFDTDGSGAKLDIGPLATMKFVEALRDARTVLWNGVLGKVEDPAYSTASTIVAEAIGKNPALDSVICGGDTSGFVEGLQETHPELKYTLISTGGGAALEFLLTRDLPGLTALNLR